MTNKELIKILKTVDKKFKVRLAIFDETSQLDEIKIDFYDKEITLVGKT